MARLPSGYQEVEYISSSGTQYINTDIKLNQSHTIELKLNINSNLNQWDKFYGGGDDGSMLFAQYEKTGTTNQNKIKITNKSGDSMYSSNTILPGYDHIFIHSNTEFYIDGVLQSSTTATTFTMNTGLNIFAMGNSQSTGREKSSYKLYYMNIFNSNNSLDYCFIPCYRKSDDEIGLYDIVNDVFYINSGTGTFTKGPEPATTGKIKRIRIEDKRVWPNYPYTPTSNTLLYLPLDGTLAKRGTAKNAVVNQGSDIDWQTILGDLKGIKFKGTANSFLYVSGIPELQSFTINCWVYLNDRSNNAWFTRRVKAVSAGQLLQVFMRPSQSYKLAFNFFTYDQYSNSSMNTGIWYNVVVTYNYSTRAKNIYFNGSNQGSTTSSGQIDFGMADLYIGNIENYTEPMNGIMSNYILEDREWSSTEVSNYYNQTKSLYGIS